MSAVVIVWLLAVLIWGFMVAADGAAWTKQKWLDLIKLAIWWLILVGLSGIILNLINPNFFRTTPTASTSESSESSDQDWAGGEDDGAYDDMA